METLKYYSPLPGVLGCQALSAVQHGVSIRRQPRRAFRMESLYVSVDSTRYSGLQRSMRLGRLKKVNFDTGGRCRTGHRNSSSASSGLTSCRTWQALANVMILSPWHYVKGSRLYYQIEYAWLSEGQSIYEAKAVAAVPNLLHFYNRLYNSMLIMLHRFQQRLLISAFTVISAPASASPVLSVPSQAWASLNASVSGRLHIIK